MSGSLNGTFLGGEQQPIHRDYREFPLQHNQIRIFLRNPLQRMKEGSNKGESLSARKDERKTTGGRLSLNFTEIQMSAIKLWSRFGNSPSPNRPHPNS